MKVVCLQIQGGKGFFRDPLLGQKKARDSLLGYKKAIVIRYWALPRCKNRCKESNEVKTKDRTNITVTKQRKTSQFLLGPGYMEQNSLV